MPLDEWPERGVAERTGLYSRESLVWSNGLGRELMAGRRSKERHEIAVCLISPQAEPMAQHLHGGTDICSVTGTICIMKRR
jgi:hypothetical protein